MMDGTSCALCGQRRYYTLLWFKDKKGRYLHYLLARRENTTKRTEGMRIGWNLFPRSESPVPQ